MPYVFEPAGCSFVSNSSSSRRKKRTLIQATRQGNKEQVERLLEGGADVVKVDGRGWTVLHEAAKAGNEQIVECLLRNGANVSATDNWGWTPLHRAASWGHSSVATMLITHGCNVNKKDKLGQTALHKALRWRHSATATLLLEHGANAKERDNADRLPSEIRFRKPARQQSLPLLKKSFVAREGETNPEKQQSLQQDKVTKVTIHYVTHLHVSDTFVLILKPTWHTLTHLNIISAELTCMGCQLGVTSTASFFYIFLLYYRVYYVIVFMF